MIPRRGSLYSSDSFASSSSSACTSPMTDGGRKALSISSNMGDMGEVFDFCPPIAPEVNDLLDFVRRHSPYYQKLWEDVPNDGSAQLHRYPVVDPKSYWASNTPFGSSVLTGPMFSGVMLRSGGTIDSPQISSYTKDELNMMSQQLGSAILAAGIRAHDRIANLFDSGDMSGSFLIHVLSLTELSVPMVHLPIGGSSSLQNTIQYMRTCNANVVFASVSKLVELATYLSENNEPMPKIRTLMFCGGPFYEDQREFVLDAFPCARLRPLMYGSFDAGIAGFSSSMFDSRQHTVSAPCVTLEIAPDGCIPTMENGVEGRVLITNLGRRLQPVVRYPTGDRAEWIDYAAGKFRILGKDAPDVLVGALTIDTVQVRQIVIEALGLEELGAFQVRMTREEMKDVLLLRVGHKPKDEMAIRKKISQGLKELEPRFEEQVTSGLVAPLRVEFVEAEEFRVNKMRKTVDVADDRYVI